MRTPRPFVPVPAVRRFSIAVALAALAGLVPVWGQKPVQDPPPVKNEAVQGAPQDKPAQDPPQERRPTFRAEANFVRVDVYPTADGRPVRDLQQADFVVFEDGRRQEVKTFEHVLIEGGGPSHTRIEPGTVRQSQDMLTDPRARLFVLFLDTYHVTRDGAWNVRRSLSRLLERTIAPNDFVAVMTPEMSAGSLTFTRRTGSIDELLDKWMVWGRRAEEAIDPDPVELDYQRCYPPKPREGAVSPLAAEMIARRREKLTLDSIRDLVLHLQGLREERKAILTVTEGWALYHPDSNLARPVDGQVPGPPEVGVGPRGGLRMGDVGRHGGSRYQCEQDRMSLAQENHEREFRDLLDEANLANASFYPIDPRGLPVFDTPLGPATAPPPTLDQAGLRGRLEALRTLAAATDGMAVLDSNDIERGLKRVVDDLTSYYLLGYYSTNAKADGRFHEIRVKVNRPGVSVRARRGYRSPTKEEWEAATRGASSATAERPPAAKAVASLERLRANAPVHAAAGYEWVPGENGAAPKPTLWVALELDANAGTRDDLWRAGADVAVGVTAADKSPVGQGRETLAREARTALLRVPLPDTVPGDYAIRVTSKPAGGAVGTTETLRVVVPRRSDSAVTLGQPLLYRRGPFSGSGWRVAGDPRYRRQERVKVELAALGVLAGAEVQLLDRNGKPLANIPVSTARREENGRTVVSGEVTLAPLTAGDYVLETTVRHGDTTQKVLAAFRIVN